MPLRNVLPSLSRIRHQLPQKPNCFAFFAPARRSFGTNLASFQDFSNGIKTNLEVRLEEIEYQCKTLDKVTKEQISALLDQFPKNDRLRALEKLLTLPHEELRDPEFYASSFGKATASLAQLDRTIEAINIDLKQLKARGMRS